MRCASHPARASDGWRSATADSHARLRPQAGGHEAGDSRAALQSIWILRDITANKQAEQEREAARSAMALAEISTILAHEIRNPLASMELFAGLIAEDPEQTAQWVSNLRAGIRLLSGTVNNVLSIHCGGSSHLVSMNLTSCMRSGVEFVQPIAEQAGVSLSFWEQKRAEHGLTIQGNENGLRQIILNLFVTLFGTHRQAARSWSRSSAKPRPGKMGALVKIMDTGCGIPAHMLEHLFEAGFSADGDTPGLGLAVCKRLMMQHGGEIRVSSRVNHGSTFELEFPTL